MASPSGSKIPESSAAARECESCRLAPGIPFCRVEWSFLCTGCASIIHAHSYVVSVTPNPNLNSNLPPFPYHPYPFPYSFANPSSDPNAVVHLSSDDEELSPADNHGKGCFQVPGRAASFRRMESVMRYREKRKSRKFEKTVRYENRRAYAELRPRLDGKFASRKGGDRKEEAGVSEDADGMPLDSTRGESGGQLEGSMVGGADLGQPDFVEDIRFQ